MRVSFGSTRFDDDDIRLIHGSKWHMDCPVMRLYPHGETGGPPKYEGSGYIAQTESGRLEMKVYCNQPDLAGYTEELFRQTVVGLGKLIPGSHYYDLQAEDVRGEAWSSERFLIDFVSGTSGAIITTRSGFGSISYAQEIPPLDHAVVQVYFPDQPALPFNQRTTTRIVAGSHVRSHETSLDTARIEVDGFTYEISHRQAYTVAEVTIPADKSLPSVETIAHAMRFVTATDLKPFVSITYRDATRGITIFPVKPAARSRRMPPLRPDITDADDYWRLFITYLQFLNVQGVQQQAVARWVRAAITAGESYLEADALGLSVAVEGVLRECFAHKAKLPLNLETDIQVLTKVIEDVTIDQATKRRLLAFLPTMKEMRVVDTLGVLQQEGQIPKHLIASWKRLRNGFAHARSIDNNKIQETLDLLYAVSVLFYHLVFIVCEYEGKFTDHSQESFPTAIVTLPKH